MTTAMGRARPGERAPRGQPVPPVPPSANPWHALWAMMVGFFMILVDSTIVAVANPSIMAALNIGYDTVIWVTSAYLLAYAVPLLVAGRLGDRFGPRKLYLIGLAVFTVASLWCGMAGGIQMLIVARAVQGVGAALLTPQTLSTITRIFPPQRRGAAMSVWGATAGVATLVGPLAGGVLVDAFGWEWIFFVNVPIGVAGLVAALLLTPKLPTHPHRFDLLGVALSGVGVFLVVFALQQGESSGWAPWVWAMVVGGVAFLAVFVYWQARNTGEPLIPLRIFADRDFGLANLGVAVIGFAATAMVLPVMFYAQAVCGLTPTRSALLTAPMAIATGVLAPIVGRVVDRSHPTAVIGFGFSVLAAALTWLSVEMAPATPIWRLVLPFAAIGVGMAFIWSPLAATATRNLPPHLAGAGSGVYNATRQVGAVLGSAGMAAFMTSRIAADMPALPGGGPAAGAALQLPEFLHEPFAAAMSESTLLPAFVALFGIAAALFMVGFAGSSTRPQWALAADDSPNVGARVDAADCPTEVIPIDADHRHRAVLISESPVGGPFADDPATEPLTGGPFADDPETEPLTVRIPVRPAEPEPIPVARNAAHLEAGRTLGALTELTVADLLARNGLSGAANGRPRRNRHYLYDPDDTDDFGARAAQPNWN